MVSRLQLRVRYRRYGAKGSPGYLGLHSSTFANCMLVTALLLLIISMATGEPHHCLAVDRYRFSHPISMPAAIRDDVMRVMLTRDGVIYFRSVRTAGEDLPDLIQQSLQSGAERKVYFMVDPRARYAALSIVLDGVRGAGIRDIAFLAESPVMHR
jgi:biopolymer transport protein ExbD